MIIHVFQLERFKNIENYSFNFINLLVNNLSNEELVNHHFYFSYFENENLRDGLALRLKEIDFDSKKVKFFNEHFRLMKSINNTGYKDILFHQLISPKIILYLFQNRRMLKKASWVIWGGDLYNIIVSKVRLKHKLFDFIIKKNVIKHLKRVIGFKSDFKLVKEKYNTNAEFMPSLYPVPSVIYDIENLSDQDSNTKRILVGHSANVANNHEEIFQKLLPFKDKNIEIICPLSYGDTDNIEKIEKIGYSLFGNKFVPLKEFYEPQKFSDLLRNVDIAIFAVQRQAAVGILATLISAGKKIYFKKNVVPFSFYNENDIVLFDTDEIETMPFSNFISMKRELKIKNITNINQLYSDKNLIEIWRRIF